MDLLTKASGLFAVALLIGFLAYTPAGTWRGAEQSALSMVAYEDDYYEDEIPEHILDYPYDVEEEIEYYDDDAAGWFGGFVGNVLGCAFFGCSSSQPRARVSRPVPYENYSVLPPRYYEPYVPQRGYVREPALMPSCDVSVSPSHIREGEGTTLMWQAENATVLYNEEGKRMGTSGIQGLRPRETRTFVFTVQGADGSTNYCSATVYVDQKPPVACNFYAQPQTVEEGESAVLRWQIPGAVEIGIMGIGEMNSTGSYTVYPERTTAYELRARDRNGQEHICSARVNVVSSRESMGEDSWLYGDLREFRRGLQRGSQQDSWQRWNSYDIPETQVYPYDSNVQLQSQPY